MRGSSTARRRFAARADVPLDRRGRESGAARSVGARGLIALPGSASVALATALAPLHALAGLERVEVATYQAVSGSGRGAMDELAGETVAMLQRQEGAGTRIRPPNRLQRDSPGGCHRGRRRVARGAAPVGGDPAGARFARTCHQRDGGAGAGVLRPQPGGACSLRARPSTCADGARHAAARQWIERASIRIQPRNFRRPATLARRPIRCMWAACGPI